MSIQTDVIIIGAGAAGLFCAIEAGRRGRRVLVLDHANKLGKKILMSGGGRCNFTNTRTTPENFISHNSHFCKSALSRYTPFDFIELVKKHNIPFHEKTLGQLFCDNKSSDIVKMLLDECATLNVEIRLDTKINSVKKKERGFELITPHQEFLCESLVIATGGLSIPTMGASPFGYKIAEQFGIPVFPTRAGLVPLTLHHHDKEKFSTLAGVGLPSVVSSPHKAFEEAMLFTHRGLSGPSILQISSYWNAGESIHINFLPHFDFEKEFLKANPKQQLNTFLGTRIPKRVVSAIIAEPILEKTLNQFNAPQIRELQNLLQSFEMKPNGTEGYRTAEVTLGGVDCDAISSKTMEAKNVPGLYFIGEVLDVTGWLGGYNFQWAWSSGWAAGQHV